MRSPSPSPVARRLRPLLAASLLLWSSLPGAHAAKPPADVVAKGADVFGDTGGFEKPMAATDNLWNGVSSDGTVTGYTFSAKVIKENGSFGDLAMPPSVAFVDLNGDGKPDLVTADPTGYFRCYPNSGTLTEPKFTYADIIPIFISANDDANHDEENDRLRMCPRIALADWRRTGVLDLLIGDYFGEVLFLPNVGSARAPAYKLPPGGPPAALVATNEQGRYWGNLFSPVACNWGGPTSKPDLLLGEGTYSANAIHLLQNLGGESTPKFSSTKHTMIAYGDGREQLIPTAGDFNGDGFPDLVIGDRTGEVGMYLSPGKPDPKVELKRTATLSFGATSKLGGTISPCAADYNGDGLTDLIIGLPNGHISVALNTGTKTEPKFGPLVEIKGTSRLGRNVKPPSGWRVETAQRFGNALSYFTVVNAQEDPESKPPEGASCLRAGHWPVQPLLFPMPDTGMPSGSKHFSLNKDSVRLNTGKTYKLSFKVKNLGMERLRYHFEARFRGYPGMDRVEKDERGGAKHVGAVVGDEVHYGAGFTAGTNWTNVEFSFTPKWRVPELQDEPTIGMKFFVDFYSPTLASQVYFDDFHLVEQ